MSDDDYLRLEVAIVCLLLFLVGLTAVSHIPSGSPSGWRVKRPLDRRRASARRRGFSLAIEFVTAAADGVRPDGRAAVDGISARPDGVALLGPGAQFGQKPLPEHLHLGLLKLGLGRNQPVAAAARDRLAGQRNQAAGLDIVIDQRPAAQDDAEAAHGGVEGHLHGVDAEPAVDRRRHLQRAGPEPVLASPPRPR